MTVIIIKPLHKNDLDAATEIILHAFKNEAFTSSWLDLDDEKTKRAMPHFVGLTGYTKRLISRMSG